MRKAIKYDLISDSYSCSFSQACNKALQEGWELYGVPFTRNESFYQALVKYEEEEPLVMDKHQQEEEIRDLAAAVNKQGMAIQFSDFQKVEEPILQHALRSIREWIAKGFIPICKLHYIDMPNYKQYRCHMVKPHKDKWTINER